MLDGHAQQERGGQQDQGDVARPAEGAAHFVLIQTQIFVRLQVLFDAPACANGSHHGGQRRVGRSKDQIIGQRGRVVEATAHDEEVASVAAACLQHREASPVEEAFAFGALALTETLPVAGAECLRGDAGDIGEQHAGAGLHTDDLDGGNRQRVGVVSGRAAIPRNWVLWP